MSKPDDHTPSPENIEWNHPGPFNAEQYLKEIGRGDRTTRARMTIGEMNNLIQRPSPQPLDQILKKWKFDTGTTKGYPLVPKVRFQTAINEIPARPYDDVVRNGDSYFSAVAMLLYGDAKYWYMTRAEHFQHFITVLSSPEHPRYDLYTRLNIGKPGVHHTSYFRLSDRIKTPNCWVHHEFIQQVTADLYNLFLIIFTRSPTSSTPSIQARGVYNSPHRILLHHNINTYSPLLPLSPRPSEFRFPRITLSNTAGLLGVEEGLEEEEEGHDRLMHPWRRPFRDTRVPGRLCPVPIGTLGRIRRDVLEIVLWVGVDEEEED